MKNLKLSKRSYLVAFSIVMILNVCLGIFLIRNVLAQTSDDKLKNQLPIKVEVVEQKDNPILITVINVDNSAESYQKINYAVQNIGNKSIRGYVVWGSGKNTGKIITNFLPTKLFQPNASFTEELFIERENLKSDGKISLTIDYVAFEDGSSWGEDTQGQSEQINGGCVGAATAAEQFVKIIENKDEATLNNIMKKPLLEVEIPLPEGFKNKSEKWQTGFRGGYKSIISYIKKQQDKGGKELLESLNEIKQNLQSERRQGQ